MPASSAAMSCTTTPNRAYDAEHRHDVVQKRRRPDEGEPARSSAPATASTRARSRATTTRTGTRATRRRLPIADRQTPPADGDERRARRFPSRGSPAVRAAPRGRPPHSRRDARWRRAADARPAEPDSSTTSRCSGTGRREETRRPRGSRRRRRRRTTRTPARRRRCSTRLADGDAQPAHRSRVVRRHVTSQYAATATGVMTAAIKPP